MREAHRDAFKCSPVSCPIGVFVLVKPSVLLQQQQQALLPK